MSNGGVTMAGPSPNRRLMKELNDLLRAAPPGIKVDAFEIEKSIRKYYNCCFLFNSIVERAYSLNHTAESTLKTFFADGTAHLEMGVKIY